MCTRGPKEGNYEFFDKIEDYIEKVKNAESNPQLSNAQSKFALSNAESKCNAFMESSKSHFMDKRTAKPICEQFVKLYYSLTDNNKCIKGVDPDYNKCSKFLNYWINFKLRKSIKNEDSTFCDVYGHLDGQLTNNDIYNIDLYFINDIDKDDLYKMNILYNLYENYNILNAIDYTNSEQDKRQLLTHSTACCPDYIKASYICNDDDEDKNPKFCEELETFKSKYHVLYQSVIKKGSDYSDYFMTLSNCPNSKIITTAVTGSIIGLIPLFGVLYKFTPLGQMFRSKKGKLNNYISNNDEDMINMSLMEHENEQIKFQKRTFNIKYQSV
ncbi:Plasmodium vivax Vir protein, putative [Plasmodium vivax]|nr:Plasmodium vivax Vir protein, putative [Plasmodium vivax]